MCISFALDNFFFFAVSNNTKINWLTLFSSRTYFNEKIGKLLEHTFTKCSFR